MGLKRLQRGCAVCSLHASGAWWGDAMLRRGTKQGTESRALPVVGGEAPGSWAGS